MGNDPERPHIERCDSCRVFESDPDAAEFVQALLSRAAVEIRREGRLLLLSDLLPVHGTPAT